MDGLSLLARARDAGLTVRIADDRLVITGPVASHEVVQELIRNKATIIAGLADGADVLVRWPTDALDHYLDRLAVAAELELDTSPGSSAEQTARREAERVRAEIPLTLWPCTRDGAVIDAVIDGFRGLGGVRFVGLLPGDEGGGT